MNSCRENRCSATDAGMSLLGDATYRVEHEILVQYRRFFDINKLLRYHAFVLFLLVKLHSDPIYLTH